MSKKRLPRIITSAVITTVVAAAFLTFTRGESPNPDTAAALVPGATDTAGPVVEGSTPTPSSTPSADTAEREAKNAVTKVAPLAEVPVNSDPTKSPTTSAPKDPDPTQPPPSPTPDAPCDLITAILGGCN